MAFTQNPPNLGERGGALKSIVNDSACPDGQDVPPLWCRRGNGYEPGYRHDAGEVQVGEHVTTGEPER
jgi:hypothetical protein